MVFGELIRFERERQQIPQKTLAAALNIDIPMYSRIERGERPAKREQVPVIARVLGMDENSLMHVWVANKVYQIVKEEDDAVDILNTVVENIEKRGIDDDKERK